MYVYLAERVTPKCVNTVLKKSSYFHCTKTNLWRASLRIYVTFGFENWLLNEYSTWTFLLLQKTSGIIRSNVAKSVKTYLETLKWEVLPHPPYSSDVTPSVYNLFLLMTHGLAHQHFRSYEEVKKWIDLWIASKDAPFFRDGIRKLPERWEKVVISDGQYFDFDLNLFFHFILK